MQGWFFVLILVLTAAALFYIGRSRAVSTVGGDSTILHSKPGFHGAFVMICGIVPAVLVFFTWLLFSRYLTNAFVAAQLGADFAGLAKIEQQALLRNMRSFADRADLSALGGIEVSAVEHYRTFVANAVLMLQVVVAILVVVGGWFAVRLIGKDLRARQIVEKTVMAVLIAASGVAILTTLGIVLSLIFESISFFKK